jgi:hypothetical protein
VGAASSGAVTLTINYPTTFHRAAISPRGQKTSSVARSTSSTRKPQYVNPTSGDSLQIYAYSETTGYSQVGTVAIGSGTVGADNSQTFSVNVPAGSYYYLEAVEVDANENTLAGGTTSGNVTVSGGETQALAITMDMNAQYVVLTTDVTAGSDAVAISTYSGSPTAFCPGSTTSLYAFAGDSQGGFVLPGVAAGGDTDAQGNPAIPKVQLISQAPTGFAAQAIGYLFVAPATSISTEFSELNPYYSGTTFGYANIQGTGTTTCPTGSLASNPIYNNQTTTLTVSNGTGPYTVTTGDNTICTAVNTSSTTFNITADYSNSGPCPIKITDANGTISAPIVLTVDPG